MLRKNPRQRKRRSGGRYAVVASTYNRRYVDSMVSAAEAELHRSGAEIIKTVRVPGAFEIPVVAARLAGWVPRRFDAVICLGVVLRGQTTHADHIGTGVTQALIRLQIDTGTPMVHEVLVLENEEQARARCLDPRRNRGTEAAQTAIEMAGVLRALATEENDVPF